MTRMFVLLSSSLLASAMDFTPAQTTNCNNSTRTLAQPAGVSGAVVEVGCAQITVSVAGVSYSTPCKCPVAYTQYMESVYTCGPALPNFNCNPQGYKATIANYTDARCPDVTGLTNGMSWDSWDDVPENLRGIIHGMSTCVAPQREDTFDWSASVTACPSQKEAPEAPLRSGTGGDGHEYFQTLEDPRAYGGGMPRFHPFETDYDRAMATGGGTADLTLQKVEASFPPLSGVLLAGSLDLEHYPAGSDLPTHASTYRYEGSISSDETFDLVETSVARLCNETWIRRERQLVASHAEWCSRLTVDGTVRGGVTLTALACSRLHAAQAS
ncbi:MAG: hypothetical protein AB1726_09185 [Planctomycetota bacterium]